jgi:hypothetical protein
MYSALKIFTRKEKSEEGFVLVVALVAVVILIAVGFYASTVTVKDIMITSRLLGQRKAFSAAEAGVHQLCLNYNPSSPAAKTDQVVDPADPSGVYSYALPVRNGSMPQISLPGYDLSKAYAGAVFDTSVTGRDKNSGSSVTISVGTAYAPNPSDTQQGNQ